VSRRALALTVVAALLCAACSDEGEPDEAGESGLRDALARVAANDQTRRYVEYGDVARLARLADGGDRFLGVLGYGFSPIAPSAQLMAEQLRFDPATMDGAVQVGQPPELAGVLWGDYDVETVDRELSGRDIPSEDSADGTRWTSADDGELSIDGPLTGIARTSELNVLHTAPATFAYAPARAGVDWVTAPGDDTLADDPLLRRLAGCLGDVVAAVIVTGVDGDPTSYAVGVRATGSGAVTEIACLAPPDDVSEMRDRVERELADGTAPTTRQPWDELLPDASVDLVEQASVVRIEAQPGADGPVGRVMRMLQTRDLAALAGG
jgi:hypothetical protein